MAKNILPTLITITGSKTETSNIHQMYLERPSNHRSMDKRYGNVDKGTRSRVTVNSHAYTNKNIITLVNKNYATSRVNGKPPPAMTEIMADLFLRPDKEIEQESHVGSVVTHIDKGSVNTRPGDYRLGDIIRIPHVIPNLDPHANLGEPHIGWTERTGPVVGKLRPAIVVGIYSTGLTCLPMWTSQGKGIHSSNVDNCLWMRDHCDDGPDWRGVKETQYLIMKYGGTPSAASYVNLTLPMSVCFTYPIKPIGTLTDESWYRLRALWTISIDKGFLRPSEQQDFADREIRRIRVTNEFEDVRRAYAESQRNADEGFQVVGRGTSVRPR